MERDREAGKVPHALAQTGRHDLADGKRLGKRLGTERLEGQRLQQGTLPPVDAAQDDALWVQDVYQQRKPAPQVARDNLPHLQRQRVALLGRQPDTLGCHAGKVVQGGAEGGERPARMARSAMPRARWAMPPPLQNPSKEPALP